MEETVNDIVFIVTISSITGILLLFIVIDLIYVYRKTKLIMEQKLELEHARFQSEMDQQEKRHLQEILDALEKERDKFASDVHDQIGANMSTIKLYFQGIKKMIDTNNDRLKSSLKEIDQAIESSSKEIRKISQNIVNGILADFGLVPALQDMADRVNGSGKIRFTLTLENMEQRFPKNVEINV